MPKPQISPATIKAIELVLSALRWNDILAVDRTVSKGDRAEVVPVKDGAKVLRVRREEVRCANTVKTH